MQAGIPFYEIPARLLVFKEALPRRRVIWIFWYF